MLSYRQKRVLLQILPFGLIPAVFSLVHSVLEKGILGDHPFYPSTGNPYEFRFVIPLLISLVIGLLIGFFEVFYINKWFQKRNFSEKILFKLIVYMLTIVVASVIIVAVGHSLELNVSPFDPEVWTYVIAFLTDFAFWSIICYYSLAIISSLFYAEVSNNMGQAVLLNFFTGKYHQPTVEERAYMFLDMKSSTTFAEQLGHVRYFRMLKEYYADLSDPILQFGGQIYQYVGDEVVISWKVKAGFAEAALRCFFAMKQALERQSEQYLKRYGVVPTFKAGIHYGKVTTGEVGVIKKEIAFSGDVLNTTARIQSLCNSYQVDLLVSEAFAQALASNGPFNALPLEKVVLRGKNEKVKLFVIEKSGYS